MTTPNQRLARMRKSFEKNKSVLAEDYKFFTALPMPRVSIPRNKAAHKSAGRSGRQSQERNETQSSGKTGD